MIDLDEFACLIFSISPFPSCKFQFYGTVESSDGRIRELLKRGARGLHLS